MLRRLVGSEMCIRDSYKATNRWTEYGDTLFRLVDRKGSDMLLGPTPVSYTHLTLPTIYSV